MSVGVGQTTIGSETVEVTEVAETEVTEKIDWVAYFQEKIVPNIIYYATIIGTLLVAISPLSNTH